MDEVAKHVDERRSVWVVVDGNVLDVTNFIAEHPGGSDVLLKRAGRDVTTVFNQTHSIDAKQLAKSFIIGQVCASTAVSDTERCEHQQQQQ